MVIFLNILINEDYSIKTTQFESKKVYDLSELLFFIPNIFNCCSIFILITDSVGVNDIIPLQFTGNYKNYKNYKINYSNSIRIKSGKIKIKILLIDSQTNELNVSECFYCDICIDNYKIAHHLVITNELNTNIKNIYDKILRLTEINTDIYDNIYNKLKSLTDNE